MTERMSMSSYQATSRSVGLSFLRIRATRLLLAGISLSCAASLFFAAPSPALAARYTFNGSVSTDWNNGANWTNTATNTTGTLPGPADVVDINSGDDPAGGGPNAGVVTISGPLTNNTVQEVYIGTDGDNGGTAGNGTVIQTAGTLRTTGNGWINLGNGAGSTGTYNMSGTATVVS